MKPIFKSFTAVLLTSLLASGATLSVPVNPELAKQIEAAASSARAEGNEAVALRQYRRLLEVYPNEPALQAPIDLALAESAGKSGEAAQAKMYAAMAKSLDPTLDARIVKAESGGAQTRGGADKVAIALAVMQTTMAAIAAARAAKQAQQPQAPPQPQQQAYAYPPAQYGQPAYQPPPGNGYAPMPGYADPNAAAQQAQYQQPQYQQQPQPQYQQPQGQPQYQQPQPQPQPQYAPPQQAQQQPQYAPPQPQYQQPQPQYQQPQGQPQYQQPQPQQAAYYPPPPQEQYVPPVNNQGVYRPTRGEKAESLRAVHDHSRTGDKNYFEKGCGALISVDGSNLMLTFGGGEAPRVIPATELAGIRLNTAVGREVGAFHILTKQGLYIHLAPESGKRDDGRADVEALRKQLGLAE